MRQYSQSQAQNHKDNAQYCEMLERSVDDFRKQADHLKDANITLQLSNNEYMRVNQELLNELRKQESVIKRLKNENQYLNQQLNISLHQSTVEEVKSSKTINEVVHNIHSMPRNRKRIFEKRTTLHMNTLSPKNQQADLEAPEPEFTPMNLHGNGYFQEDIHQVITRDVKVFDYSPDVITKQQQIQHIIGKYIKSPEKQQQQPIQVDIKLNQVYEEFLIISVTKQQIQAVQKDQKIMQLRPEILFQHPNQNIKYANQLKLLPQLIYPYGIKCRMEEKTMSMSNLNSILMGGQSYDRLSGAFVIVMKSDESFMESTPPIYRKYYMDNIDDFIAASNIQHSLYCICVQIPDFYDCDIDDPSKSIRSSKSRHRKHFYSITKTYCFITRAPLINFFIDTLKIIINTLKYKKAEIYSMIAEAEDSLANIDNTFYMSFKPELFEFLKSIQQARHISDCHFQFLQTPLTPPNFIQTEPQLYEIEWALGYALQHMTIIHYIILLITILLEQNICVISANRTLQSSLLTILPHIIKPFSFIHPIVFSLNIQLMPMLDSPVPCLCGIYRDDDNGLQDLGIDNEEEFINEQSHIVFYDADKMKFYNLPANYTESTLYKNLFYLLFQTYEQITNSSVPGHYIVDNYEQTMAQCFEILKITSQFIASNILNQPLNTQEDDLIVKIQTTQYFAYYRQQML